MYSFQIDLPAVSFVENYDVNHDYHQSARSYFSSPGVQICKEFINNKDELILDLDKRILQFWLLVIFFH